MELSKVAYGDVKDLHFDIAILPWGATEPHNLHLPYLTDAILAHEVSADAAKLAEERYGVRAMVLPALPLGAQNPGQRELPFCIHYSHQTQFAVLRDIVHSLNHQGIKRLLIVNGHGGNSFKSMIRDLAVDYPDFLIASSEWFTVESPAGYFEEKDDHAGELETSVMMYYHPEWVKLEDAGEGKSKPFGVKALNDKVAWVPRNWTKVTEDTGIGNPRKASAQKGERFAKAVVARYVELFTGLIRQPLYPD